MKTEEIINDSRTILLSDGTFGSGSVICWMEREQRLHNNYTLLAAQKAASILKRDLVIIFILHHYGGEREERHYRFMLDGLTETVKQANRLLLPMTILTGEPVRTITQYCTEHNAAALFTDFNPLRHIRTIKKRLAQELTIPIYETDARNIIPCRSVSPKQEYSAHTLRLKHNRIIDNYVAPVPRLKKGNASNPNPLPDTETLIRTLSVSSRGSSSHPFVPGTTEAKRRLKIFLTEKIGNYATDDRDPNRDVLSELSPYIHFGQISVHHIVNELIKSQISTEGSEKFYDQLVIRRELSENFIYYNSNYDSLKGIPDWGKRTLDFHRGDLREYNYSFDRFENGETDDELWNAAQRQMVQTGKMHCYLRMYWAKKILEWSASPEEAFNTAITLNDRYSLDGEDPNGYAGVAWSIGGLHDRPWSERPVFGYIRFMNLAGCKRKFNVNQFVKRFM
ncbi:MAG: deoxyribodipyrimidine photo-lyase [Spirochaetes bacterium]|jgi:deoxyribodipyrimidine photo-lyase|nr:deoxyribodipyrimidine photo-lyase [Spirochaetota bacterium]